MKKEIKKVKKLLIPAAGWGTRFLPLTKVIHKELVPVLDEPLINLLVNEALDAGIEEIYIIISERKKDIVDFFKINKNLEEVLKKKNKTDLLEKVKKTNKPKLITPIFQTKQYGLGHALACAKDYIKDEPFGVILGDDLIKSKIPAIKQLVDFYYKTGANILGVQSVADENVHKYGIVEPKNSSEKNNKYFEIKNAVEKPKLKYAPSNKAILGRYVFNPEILEILSKIKFDGKNEIQVVDAFCDLFNKYKQKIYAFEFEGTRYDLGSIDGFVKANIDYALEDESIKESIKEHIENILKKK